MNGFDKVIAPPPPFPPNAFASLPSAASFNCRQILRKHDVLLGANTHDEFLSNVAWRSVMCVACQCASACGCAA